MSLGPEHWPRVKDLFDRARACAPEARREFLAEACADNEALRREVESLLASSQHVNTFLETPAVQIFDGPSRAGLLEGRRIGPYRLSVRIGAGGMGEVYKAVDIRLDRTVAIKIISAAIANNPQSSLRFEREARAISSLNHAHICTLFDVGRQDGIEYLVMEYCDGETLAARLKSGPLRLDEVMQYAIEIASALRAAHARGIIHRDLKPGNIMLTEAGTKLLDFGLAKRVGALPGETAVGVSALRTEAPDISREGVLLGTLNYMAPEQLEGREADARTDLFALGAVMYEMTTGRRAFDGATQANVIAAILEREPPALTIAQPLASTALKRIVDRCLAKDPNRRWHSAADVYSSLEDLAHHRVTREPTPPPPTEESVAVLPLHDNPEPDLEYLSDGIAEALTSRLTRIPGLRVAPWTMVRRTKGHPTNLASTAKRLAVRTLLVLRLVVRDDVFQLHAEWMDPKRRAHLWGARYRRGLSDLYCLEDEIAVDLAHRISPDLKSSRVEEIRKRHTSSGPAYQRYLKGRYLWNQRTADALQKAIQHFRGALDQDPGFALALGGIADCHLTLGTFLFASPADSLPLARAAVTRALEIEPELSEARATLGVINAFFDWDWEGSEREFKKALDLSPQYPTARQWYGFSLCARGRFTAGRAILQSAIDLDPLSPMHHVQLAAACYLERRYDDAMALCREVLETEPRFWAAMLFLGQCHDATGRIAQAVEYLRRAAEFSADNPLAVAGLAHALAREGRSAEAEALLSDLRSRSRIEYVAPYALALVCCGLGRHDDAVDFLEQAHTERSPALAFWIKGEPRLDPLRPNPAFQHIVASVGV